MTRLFFIISKNMTRALKKLAHLYVGLKRKDESNKFDIFHKKYIRLDIATYVSLSVNHNFKERTKRKLI